MKTFKQFLAESTYTLYRSGDLSAPNKMLFFSPDRSVADSYSNGRKIGEYQVRINNPLTIDAINDVDAILQITKKLQGKDVETASLDGDKWQKLDKRNAELLKKSPYDAIFIKQDGKIREVQIAKDKFRGIKLKEIQNENI